MTDPLRGSESADDELPIDHNKDWMNYFDDYAPEVDFEKWRRNVCVINCLIVTLSFVIVSALVTGVICGVAWR